MKRVQRTVGHRVAGRRRVALAILLAGSTVWAQAEPLPETLAQAIAGDAQRLTRSRKPPGLAVAIVVNDDVLWADAWGRADLGSDAEFTTKTSFPLGDVSKLYTAALALKLEAEGRVDLDGRLDAALPDIRIASRFEGVDPGAITLRQLLSGHAGLPPERWAGAYGSSPSPAGPAPLPASDALYLLRPPGQLHGYSNVGVVLAGEWLARAAGERFDVAMSRRVLRPLRLEASGYEAPSDRAIGHEGRTPQPPVFMRDAAPSGLYASTEDVARFIAALMPSGAGGASRLLPAAQTRALFGAHNEDVVLDLGHGIGLGFSVQASSRPAVGRVLAASSLQPDTFAEVMVFVDHGVGLVVLGNAGMDRASGRFMRRLVDRLLAWRAKIPPRPDDDPDLPDVIPLPSTVRDDAPAARYNTLAGLVPIRREADGFVARVLGWSLHARPRSDGWYRLSWHLLGFIPIEPGLLERILVRPVRAKGRRLLLLWAGGRSLVVGSTFDNGSLSPRWRALVGRYRLLNGDPLTRRMKVEAIELANDDDALVVRYPLTTPFRTQIHIPVEPLADDRLFIPGFGGTLGEQAQVRFGPPPRIEFAGYLFERES